MQSWAKSKGKTADVDDKTKGKDLKGWAGAKDKAGSVKDAAGGHRLWMTQTPKNMLQETWMSSYNKHPWEGGQANEERRRTVQDPIIRKALDGVSQPAPGEQKMAVFTMGGPGSGKSSMTKSLDPKKFVHVDPDDVREQLPEYQKLTKGDVVYKYASSMSHPEASDIAARITDEAVKQGKHVIIDGTGSNAASMMAKMDELKKAGYHIHLAYAHLGVEEGLKRIDSRAEETGRWVPTDWARDAYNKIPRNFQEVAKHADTYAVHDTTTRASPVVWKKGEDGKEQELDEDFVRGFKTQFGKNSEGRERKQRTEAIV